MDTSELYIKMADCPEIQEAWRGRGNDPKIGDFTDKGIVVQLCYREAILTKDVVSLYTYQDKYSSWNVFRLSKDKIIFLPRPDQSQAMVQGKVIYLIDAFYFFAQTNLVNSWEQLWLAYVMWELHKKQWDGKKWLYKTHKD